MVEKHQVYILLIIDTSTSYIVALISLRLSQRLENLV